MTCFLRNTSVLVCSLVCALILSPHLVLGGSPLGLLGFNINTDHISGEVSGEVKAWIDKIGQIETNFMTNPGVVQSVKQIAAEIGKDAVAQLMQDYKYQELMYQTHDTLNTFKTLCTLWWYGSWVTLTATIIWTGIQLKQCCRCESRRVNKNDPRYAPCNSETETGLAQEEKDDAQSKV